MNITAGICRGCGAWVSNLGTDASCRFCRVTKAGEAYEPTIFDLVKKDLDARDAKGAAEYGGPMLAGDGRDTLWDAYEEALDLVMYLRKAIEERHIERDGR